MSDRELQELASQVAATMGKAKAKPRLVLVEDGSNGAMNALQRDVIYGRIYDLSAQYNLGWLVRQDTMHVLGVLECLRDDELTALLGRLETAVECIHEGVPFVERGLVKGATCNWVA